jgi:hypothetical protein
MQHRPCSLQSAQLLSLDIDMEEGCPTVRPSKLTFMTLLLSYTLSIATRRVTEIRASAGVSPLNYIMPWIVAMDRDNCRQMTREGFIGKNMPYRRQGRIRKAKQSGQGDHKITPNYRCLPGRSKACFRNIISRFLLYTGPPSSISPLLVKFPFQMIS